MDQSIGRIEIAKSLLLGDKNYWNKGLAAESIYAITKHLFEILGMYRVGADSCNPAFINLVTKKLGWTIEGAMRKRMLLGDKRIDYSILGILKDEFSVIPMYEDG